MLRIKKFCSGIILAVTGAILTLFGSDGEDLVYDEGIAYLVRMSPLCWWEGTNIRQDAKKEIFFALMYQELKGSDEEGAWHFAYVDGVGVLSARVDRSVKSHLCALQSMTKSLEAVSQAPICPRRFSLVKAKLLENLEEFAQSKEVLDVLFDLDVKEFEEDLDLVVVECSLLCTHMYEELIEKQWEETLPNFSKEEASFVAIDTIGFFQERYRSLGENTKGKIADLIHHMGYKEKKWLLKHAKKMRVLGKQVDDVHPFLFLAVIHREKDLYGNNRGLRECLRQILNDTCKKIFFIYGEPFRDGLKHKLQKLTKAGQIEPYLPGFAAWIDQDEAEIRLCIENKSWEQLLRLVVL